MQECIRGEVNCAFKTKLKLIKIRHTIYISSIKCQRPVPTPCWVPLHKSIYQVHLSNFITQVLPGSVATFIESLTKTPPYNLKENKLSSPSPKIKS